MNLTLDQYDIIHMHLRRASAISSLIAECSESQEQIEMPAEIICIATNLIVELVDEAQQNLRNCKDGKPEDDGRQDGCES